MRVDSDINTLAERTAAALGTTTTDLIVSLIRENAPELLEQKNHVKMTNRQFDDFSREVVGQLVSVSISGQQVARFLSQVIETRDRPDSIVCDNGTEFTSKAMFFWSKTKGVRLSFIQPGKPTQNGSWKALTASSGTNA